MALSGLRLYAAPKKAHAQVGLIDKTNHHVFQPLLYPVATGILSPEHIAAPLRQVLGKQLDTIVLKETVIAVDAQKKLCVVEGACRVRVTRLASALRANDVVIGGGNVKNLKKPPPRCRTGDDAYAFLGGFRMWETGETKASPGSTRK